MITLLVRLLSITIIDKIWCETCLRCDKKIISGYACHKCRNKVHVCEHGTIIVDDPHELHDGITVKLDGKVSGSDD